MVGGDPRTCPPLTGEEIGRWYVQIYGDALHWVIEVEARCVGTARLHSLDEHNRRARHAIGIFDPALWSKDYGSEATQLVLEYAFAGLKLHRVDLCALSLNKRAIVCCEQCGFVQEGVEREGAYIRGEWQSDVRMSILVQEWRNFEHAK